MSVLDLIEAWELLGTLCVQTFDFDFLSRNRWLLEFGVVLRKHLPIRLVVLRQCNLRYLLHKIILILF